MIRAVASELGVEWMRGRRAARDPRALTNGPAKLCQALDIDRRLDGSDLCQGESPIFVARNPRVEDYRASFGPVRRTARIGLTKAADWPLRFVLAASPFLSRKAECPPCGLTVP